MEEFNLNILAVDDEELALELLVDTIKSVKPHATVFPFKKVSQSLKSATQTHYDVAFLDIEMRGKNGISLAKELKDINPKINIIFVTGYAEYALDAFSVLASDYLLKPITKDSMKLAFKNLRNAVDLKSSYKLYIQCFGNFEVFNDGEALYFTRAKTKELFAYLVNRRGAWCSVREIAAVLWEDKEDGTSLQSYLRILVSELITLLKSIGAEHILLKKRGMLALQTNCFGCDFYAFVNGDSNAINSYTGEYMTQYGWAEYTNAYLNNLNHVN